MNGIKDPAPAVEHSPAVEHFVGIDVAKRKLDVAVLPSRECFSLDYSDEGLKALVSRLTALKPTLVVVEASGGYERRVAGELTEAAVPVAVVNPSRVRQLARGTGTLAKNDKLDSLNLALFAQVVRPAPREKAPELRLELEALVTRRRQLVAMTTMETNRLKQLPAGRARESVVKIRTRLEAE